MFIRPRSPMERQEDDMITKSEHTLQGGIPEDNPLKKLRLLCLSRGTDGILDLGRVFRRMDHDGDRQLSLKGFIHGLRDMGITEISHEEAEVIFEEFHDDIIGGINIDELLNHIRPPMSESRKTIIEEAFQKVDKSGDGEITMDDLKKVYNVDAHPLYINGDESKEQIIKKFIAHFESPDSADGRVTKEEFINYYCGVSASVEEDCYFDLIIREAYKL